VKSYLRLNGLKWAVTPSPTISQLRTGQCQLLASYLHRIGRQQSPMCPHCGSDDETAQRLLLHWLSLMQAQTSTSYSNSSDPKRM